MRALVVLAAAVALGSAWARGPAVPAAAGLGGYALTDTTILGIPVNPPAPTGVSAVPHDRSALVSWTRAAPSTSTVVSYRVYVAGTLRTQVPGTQASATVTGLTNHQVSPQITVRTFDSDGLESAASNGVTTTPYDDVAPAAVTGLVATRGDGRVTLTWDPESGAESDRTGVRVHVDGALRTSLPAATTTYDITGLTNDREYAFYLVAYDARPNGYGSPPVNGPNASGPSTTVRATPTDLTPPSAPTALTAVRGDTTVALTWTAPSENDVGLYKVVDENGVLIASFTAAAISGTATAMTNGRAHRLRLVAVDTHGNHSPASAEVTVTPAAPPIARTGLTADRGDTRVTLAWNPPTGDPRFAAAASIRVLVDGVVRTTVAGTATSHVVTGLTNDVEYAFSLIAVDAEGRAGPGTARVSATPTDLTPPSAPTAFTAARGDASAALTWGAPPENDVGRYDVVDEDGVLVASFTAPATSGTATALANGQTYRLRLVAVDTQGNRSAPSNEVSVTPTAPPPARTSLTASAGDGQITLTWDARVLDPVHDPASTIEVSVDGTVVATLPGTATSYTATGLSGVEHVLVLVAVDASGRRGPPATVRATPRDTTAPAVPTALTAARGGSGEIALSWSGVADPDLARYEVVDAGGAVVAQVPAGATTVTVGGLTDGTSYTYRVRAVDRSGNASALSSPATLVPLAPPLAVAGPAARASGPDVVLTWQPPATPTAGTAATTQVQVYRVGGPDALVTTVPAGTVTFTVPGAGTSSPPSFYLVALDADGRPSAASPTVSAALGAPQGVSATSGPQSARISWSAVVGAEVYRVERLDGSTWTAQGTVTAPATSLDVTGLADGTQHTFRVVATAPTAGTAESAPSVSVTVVAGWTGPTTPLAGGSGGSVGVAASRDGRYAVMAVPGAAGVDLVRVDHLGPERRTVATGIDAAAPRFARAAISEDGRYVVLVTRTSHSSRVANGRPDLYRYDVTTGTWALVSAPAGTGPQGSATDPVPELVGGVITTPDRGPTMAVTGDGSRVFFLSGRTDLVTNDTNGAVDLFAKDVATGTVTRVTPASGYTPTGTGFALTPDGRYVLYASGSNLVRQSTTAPDQRVLVTGSAGNPLGPLPGVGQLAISDDGSRVLATTVSGAVSTVVQADLTTPVAPPAGAPVGTPPTARATAVTTVDYGGGQVAIAPGGTHAFVATRAALVSADTNGHVDVYRVDLATSATDLVTGGPSGGGAVGRDASTGATQAEWGSILARDATHVVLVTQRPLVAGDDNGLPDAYAVDLGSPGASGARLLVGS